MTRCLGAMICLVVWPLTAWGHGLGAHVQPHEGRLRVEAYFDDDTPAIDARVRILQGNKVLIEGRTDERGLWLFDLPKAGVYTLDVDAEDGHRIRREFTVRGSETEQSGPSRDDFTRSPWTRLAFGLILLAVTAWVFSRRRVKS